MEDLGPVSKAVEAVMRCCFGGSLDDLHTAVKEMLSADSDATAQYNGKLNGVSHDENTFSCVELSALESLRDAKQHTVAHIAAAGANIDILQFLLTSMPALAYTQDENGETPLFYAIRAATGRGDLEKAGDNFVSCALLLLGHTGPNGISKSGASALHVAVELGALDVCAFLVEHGADVNIYSEEYGTPLTVAVIRDYMDVINFLLSQGANPDGLPVDEAAEPRAPIYNCRFPPPLVFACSSGQRGVFDMLISAGANVDIQDAEGWTPLHCAAEIGAVDLVNRLVDLKANCNIKVQGKTAYHLAVWNGHGEVVNVLRNLTEDKGPIDRVELQPQEEGSDLRTPDEDPEICADVFIDKPSERDIVVRNLREEGKTLVGAKDYKKACLVYSRAIALLKAAGDSAKQDLAVAYSNRSHTYLMQGDVGRARKDAELCIANNPSWPKGYFRLALVDKECKREVDYLNNLFQAYSRDTSNESMRNLFQQEFLRVKNAKTSDG